MPGTRRLLPMLAVAAVLAGLLPGRVAAADPLPAPALLAPVDGIAGGLVVHFRWERVPGAARYRVRAWYPDPAGVLLLDERTVNDDLIGVIDRPGGTISWGVVAVDGDGNEGSEALGTFTAASVAPQLVGPVGGETITFPAESVALRYRTVYGGGWARLHADQAIGSPDIPPVYDGASNAFPPGPWRWQMRPEPPLGPAAPASELETFNLAWPESTPQLAAPADATIVLPGEARLAWSEVPGAVGYRWEIAGADGSVYGSVDYVQQSWAEVAWAQRPGTWTWRVRAVMAGSSPMRPLLGPWSASRTFVVEEPAPPVPQSPADGAPLSDWPLLRWSPVPNAARYLLQVSDRPDEQAPQNEPKVAAFAFRAPGNGWGFYGAQAGTVTRYWRVAAVMNAYSGLGSTWSAWRSFTVSTGGGSLPAATAAPQVSPADCGPGCPDAPGAPILRWQAVAGAAFYRVFQTWADGPDAAYGWVDMAGTAMPVDRYHRLHPEDRMGWAVVACAGVATCPETTSAMPRRLAITLPVPELLGPVDGTTQDGPAVALDWAPVPDPVDSDVLPVPLTYALDAWTINAYGQKGYYPTTWPAYPRTMATVALRSEPGTVLHWRVAVGTTAFNTLDTQGPWSDERTVERVEPAPQLAGPIDGAGTDAWPRFAWTPADYAVGGYEIAVTRAGDELLWGPGFFRWHLASPGTSMRSIYELAPGDYRWKVRRADNGFRNEDSAGPWSGEGTFTVEGDPVIHLTEPAAGATVVANDITLAWDPFPTAQDYAVLIGLTPDITYDNAIYRGGSPTNLLPVTEALPDGDLYWMVCAPVTCSDPAGLRVGTSMVRALHVLAAPGPDGTAPAVSPPSILPVRGAALGATGAIPTTVSWTAVDAGSGIASQRVTLQRDGATPVEVAATRATRSVTLALAPGHTYTVRVRAMDAVGNARTASSTITTSLRQETGSAWAWSRSWTRRPSATASKGYLRRTKTAGAVATLTVKARAVAVVAPRSATRGSATVYVDGVKAATVHFDANPTGARRLVFTRSWASAATHRIRVVVSGTAGHPRVDLDAAVVFR